MIKTADQQRFETDVGIRPAPSRRGLGGSTLRALLARAGRPEVLSFAVGMPAEALFPTAAVAAAARLLEGEAARLLQYGMPSEALKQQVVQLMTRRGVRCSPEQVFLTSGAQQGMDLLARLLLDPGDEAMVERIAYEGILLALRNQQARLLPVATDARRGIDVDQVEAMLAGGARPAFLFLIPDGHNPLGVSLEPAARRRLVALSGHYGVPLVEDDAYGFLCYDGDGTPALRALDDRLVIYLGSFSKLIAPSLRVGWMIVPEHLVPALSSLKHATDIDSATFSQHLLAAVLEDLAIAPHLDRVRSFYRRRRDAMVAALDRHLGGIGRWSVPQAGFYVWLELPPRVDTSRLLEQAIRWERIAFSPGAAFAAADGRHADACLRLSFARLSPATIEEGIARLARAVHRALG